MGTLATTTPIKHAKKSDIYNFVHSTIISCSDGFCWNQANEYTLNSPAVDHDKVNPQVATFFDQIAQTWEKSISMLDCKAYSPEAYASRWNGHLPLAPMPSNNSPPQRRRRCVR